MSNNEDIYLSFHTLLKLIGDEYAKEVQSSDEAILHEKKIDFLVDDLLTKAGHLNLTITKEGRLSVEPESEVKETIPSPAASIANIDYLRDYFEECSTSYKNMQAQFASLEGEIRKKMNWFKGGCVLLIISWVFAVFFTFNKLGWNGFEPVSWIIAFVPVMAGVLYVLRFDKYFDLVGYLRNKRESYTKSIYLNFGFDEHRYKMLADKCDSLSKLLN